jgi:Flp pilus assembly protein TadG
MRLANKFIRKKQGQALVEMALILPLLILILMGTMEFGRIFHSYLLITNASREGARAGIISGTDPEIKSKVKDVAATLGLTDDQITITPAPSARTRGVPLTVKVDYSVNLITPVLDFIVPNPFSLTASTTMRME